MPRRKAAWASWNYLSQSNDGGRGLAVTYWMNRLQHIDPKHPLFVTLNPAQEPASGTVHAEFDYEHPVFDQATDAAQRQLWSLQGQRGTWFCGAYFGWGFHEDGLQAGLAVAEDLGGVRRPWTVERESYRIHRAPLLPSYGQAAE
jgi:predicted NAD/FAD-binding protein